MWLEFLALLIVNETCLTGTITFECNGSRGGGADNVCDSATNVHQALLHRVPKDTKFYSGGRRHSIQCTYTYQNLLLLVRNICQSRGPHQPPHWEWEQPGESSKKRFLSKLSRNSNMSLSRLESQCQGIQTCRSSKARNIWTTDIFLRKLHSRVKPLICKSCARI